MSYERFEGTGEFGYPDSNDALIAAVDVEASFNLLNAQRWIDAFRAEKRGRLDIDKTADNVGVELEYVEPFDDNGEPILTAGTVSGIGTDEPILITINPEWYVHEYPAVFGYLLGRVYLETAAEVDTLNWGKRRIIESFCDLFSRQLMMPEQAFTDFESLDGSTLLNIMVQHQASYQDVIHQLMLHSKLPRRISFDTRTGETKNPFYSNRIDRCIVCLDCELEIKHNIGRHTDTTPNFDFTQHQWSSSNSMTECAEYDRPSRLDEFVALNRQYGNWSTEDDLLIPEQRKREEEIRQLTEKYIRDGTYELPDLDTFDD